MLYRFILIALSALFLVQCHPEDGDLSGNIQIKGTLYLNDTIHGFAGEEVLSKQKILLKNPADSSSLNYLYSTESDNLGNFSFTNLSPVRYRVYAEAERSGVRFVFDSTFVPQGPFTTIKAVLYPNYKKTNLLSVVTRDAAGGAVPFVTVCFFTSSVLAAAGDCNGSSFSLATDKYGRAFTTQLEPGTYFINVKHKVGNIEIGTQDQVKIDSTKGYYFKSLLLK